MNIKKVLLYSLVSVSAVAQTPKNQLIKSNVSSLVFGVYNAQYEHSFGKRISVNVGVNYRPKKVMPFAQSFSKLIDFADKHIDYVSFENIVKEETEIGLLGITPEIRIYLGNKPALIGTYLAVFGSYNSYPSKVVGAMELPYKNLMVKLTLPVETQIHTKTYGLMIGRQFQLGQRFTVDWNIIGGHWGTLKPHGESKQDLSGFDDDFRNRLKNEIIETFSIDTKFLAVDVNKDGVKIDNIQKLPFANVRGFTIGVGYKF